MPMGLRVILVGHAISPRRGSEPGNTWNWAWELSQHVSVEVFAFPEYRREVEEHLAENPNPRLKIRWVTLRGFDPWRPEKGERGIRLHYLLWLREVYNAIRESMLESRTKDSVVVHHVSWNTVSAPPRVPQGLAAVWGLVGVGQVAPWAFRRLFGRAWLGEAVRTFRVKALPFLPGWRRRVASIPLILSTNRDTEALLRKAGARSVLPFLDCGIPKGFGLSEPPDPKREAGSPFRLLWAGRFEPRKALPLALRALTRVQVPVELWVAGEGPRRDDWQAEAHRLGLGDRVRFLGRVPLGQMQELFRQADAFIFTSLRDSSGSVVLEAMAFGLPVIVPDHQGVGTFVPNEAGIKVPVITPEATLEGFARAIERMALDREARNRMALAAWRFAQQERWDRGAERMLGIYEELSRDAHRDF
ncbi:MAG: hypothetical protein C4326_02955 [Ignavibacteria bacterium]